MIKGFSKEGQDFCYCGDANVLPRLDVNLASSTPKFHFQLHQ